MGALDSLTERTLTVVRSRYRKASRELWMRLLKDFDAEASASRPETECVRHGSFGCRGSEPYYYNDVAKETDEDEDEDEDVEGMPTNRQMQPSYITLNDDLGLNAGQGSAGDVQPWRRVVDMKVG
ncbi:hypothetical protein LTR60_001867 [Cryomyces antarcticus]|nr:hypothetical protein LTR60_001867 [Cryomyces antarcticus]